ncbi:MAG: DUF896 domain-containing protein [Clostridia bacterium]|nr:DUF896 domain-containing protein [Clostridia bacterium]
MEPIQIERINALARKQKTEGLTEEEKREQQALRQQYLKEFRENLRQTLDRVYIQQEDGSYSKLQRKFSPGNDPDAPNP